MADCNRATYLSEGHAAESATENQTPEHCDKCGYWHLKREAAKPKAEG
jgi:hypothetical protein